MSVSLDYFLPYQRRWIDSGAPFVVGEKSRRIGWTYASSYRAVERRVQGLSNLYFSSADLTAAKEFIDYCRTWAGVFNVVAQETMEELVIEDEKIVTLVLTFGNGRKIVAGSSNPKFFRSKGGDADVDEFAHHRDGREMFKAAHATAIFWEHQLRMWSTHNGEGAYFNQLCKAAKEWARVRAAGAETMNLYKGPKLEIQTVTVLDAVEQGIVEKIKKLKHPDAKARQEWLDGLRDTCPDDDTWNEEYMCRPSNENSSLLPYHLIQSCEDPAVVLLDIANLPTTGLLYAGYDVGRSRDLSVLWVLEKVGDVFWTRCVRKLANTNYTAQEELLNLLMRNPAVKRCSIDRGLIGGMLAERQEQRHGYRSEGIQFTVAMMAELAMPLLRAFQDRRLRIPADAENREALHKVRKVVNGNNVRFAAEHDEKGHADEFWALSLALHAADDLNLPLPAPLERKPIGL